MSEETDIFLNDTWSLYFHDPDNSNWGIESYILISTISSVHDWLKIFEHFKDEWHKGMFFLMREHIQPIWEDKHNSNGGCISFKIWKNELKDSWFELSSKILGETLLNKEYINNWENICGVSISPKRKFCIARIWLSNDTNIYHENYNFNFPLYTSTLYKYGTLQLARKATLGFPRNARRRPRYRHQLVLVCDAQVREHELTR